MPKKKAAPPPEVEVVDPIDPDEDFSDVSGDPGSAFRLENTDPTREYIWAHSSTEGVSSMRANVVGYVIEHYLGDDWRESDAEDARGPVRPVGMAGFFQKGERIMVRDHVLMSAPRALVNKRKRYLSKLSADQWVGRRKAVRDVDIHADDAASSIPGNVRAQLRDRANTNVQTFAE